MAEKILLMALVLSVGVNGGLIAVVVKQFVGAPKALVATAGGSALLATLVAAAAVASLLQI